jgi:predicted site-specific integrase-resolvase
MDNKPLTAAQVGAMFGVGPSTVKRWPADKLPYFTTPGGHRRYRPADVQAAITAGTVTRPATPVGAAS